MSGGVSRSVGASTTLVLVGLVLLGCSGTDHGSAISKSPEQSASIERPTTSTAGTDPVAGVVDGASTTRCSKGNNPPRPSVVALELDSGTPRWEWCSEQSGSVRIVGRADGATLIVEPAWSGGASLVALDDRGIERWRHPYVYADDMLRVAGASAVVTTDAVRAVEAATGDRLWDHPVEEGRPIGSTDDLIIEVVTPSGASGTTEESAAAGPHSLRVLDARTGEQRWTRDVDLVTIRTPNLDAPSVGDRVIAVPGIGSTTILDAATGEELDVMPAMVEARGSVLLERGTEDLHVTRIIEPSTGATLAPPDGDVISTVQREIRAVRTGRPASPRTGRVNQRRRCA